jgi:hypothetical protein
MKSQNCALTLAFAASIPSALAWGDLGHETIAYIATNFGMKVRLDDVARTDEFPSHERNKVIFPGHSWRYNYELLG